MSRRNSKKQSQLDELRKMKLRRESGLRHDDIASDNESGGDDLYEYLSEDEYRKRMKNNQGAFVVDDDGTGYVDDNEELDGDIGALKRNILGHGAADSSSKRDQKSKKGKKQKQALDDGKNQKLAAMFSKVAAKNTSRASKRAASQSEREAEESMNDASLDNMLNDLVSKSASSSSKKKRKSSSKKHKKAKKKKRSKRASTEDTNAMDMDLDAVDYIKEEEEEEEELEQRKAKKLRTLKEEEADSEKDKSNDSNQDEDDGPTYMGDGGMHDSDDENENSKSKPKSDEQDGDSSDDELMNPKKRKNKLLAAAKKKPVRSAPKAYEPSTPPPSGTSASDFMATPPAIFGPDGAIMEEIGQDKSGWSSGNAETAGGDTIEAEPVLVGDEAETNVRSSKTPTIHQDKNGNEYFDMFYMDMYEDPYTNKGTVYLFGKTYCKDREAFVSCSVKVTNIERVLYVLPRENPLENPEDEVTMQDVKQEIHQEVINKVLKAGPDGSRAYKCKPTKLKYAFELPDVPREETEYLEVHYPMCCEKFEAKANDGGNTYSRIFGTNQSATEQLVLSCKLKGPMWIRVKKADFPELSTTWCKYHAEISNPRNISPLKDELIKEASDGQGISMPDPPKMRLLSLTIKTVVNKDHKHQVMMVSGIVRDNVDLVSATPDHNRTNKVKVFTIVCGGQGNTVLPPEFRQVVKTKKAKQVIVVLNERMLLSRLVTQIGNLDPDVVLGHNIRQFDMDVLLARMEKLNVQNWSKVGRLRRGRFPKRRKDGGGFSSFLNLAPGRLLLDTYTTAKELVLGQRSYALTELCRNLMNKDRIEIQPQAVPLMYKSGNDLLKLVTFNEADAWMTLQLSFKLEAMPLTMQLSSLAGNVWSRTLNGGRAERIEYLLMHEFFRLGYLLPDRQGFSANASKNKKKKKKNGKGKNANDGGNDLEGQQKNSRSQSRKPKYSGGLVLEPKKGLYDKYILLLDFNSLYPSIIQEYNICYTTVERKLDGESIENRPSSSSSMLMDEEGGELAHNDDEDDENELPPLPDRGIHKELAVLPSLIQELVHRRRLVKKEIKKENDPAKLKQLDVRQKALKLTANSMYGCLGFTSFRFFAKPIAALVTSQGRSILQNTVDIAQEKLNYEVVYGDTDSIMVNTNTTDLQEVKKIGNAIKKEINKLYNLLEIEQDGVFKTLLLLKKKKYAALAVKETKGPDGILKIETEKETKGLDLVRRDWCTLSKRVGHTVLDFILSGREYDEIVEGIHEYLDQIHAEIKENKVPLKDYVITKGLNKRPQDYPDAKSQPHLTVALEMVKRGKPVNTGDTIPYVICTLTRDEFETQRAELLAKKAAGENTDELSQLRPRSSNSYTLRAFHPEEMLQDKTGLLKVDIDWYIKQQLVPPTQRLCEPIQGTSAGEIAQHLGLDPSSFQQTFKEDEEDSMLRIADISDMERYKNCKSVMISCQECDFEYPMAPGGIMQPASLLKALENAKEEDRSKCKVDSRQAVDGLCCPLCKTPVDLAYLSNKLQLAARQHIGDYYGFTLIADDPSVELETRQQSIHGRSFVYNGRRVQLEPKYGSSELYTQLKYLESLPDTDRALAQIEKQNAKSKDPMKLPKAFSSTVRGGLSDAKEVMSDSYIKSSAYNWVEPDLFKNAFRL